MKITDELKYDEDLIKLQEIPVFLPIMQAGDTPSIRLNDIKHFFRMYLMMTKDQLSQPHLMRINFNSN